MASAAVALTATSAHASADSRSSSPCVAAPKLAAASCRALGRPVRDGELRDPAAGGGLQRLEADAPGADDERALLSEIAERPRSERERHRAGGRGVRADRGLGAGAAAGRDRGAEEQREHRACGRGRARRVLRVPDLAEDLRFAEHERVEPRGDAAEVPADVLARVDVEVVDEQLAVDAVALREHVDQLLARALDPVREVRVELDAVAGREHGVLLTAGQLPAAGPSAPSRSRSSTGAVRWLRPRQTRRSTSGELYPRVRAPGS